MVSITHLNPWLFILTHGLSIEYPYLCLNNALGLQLLHFTFINMWCEQSKGYQLKAVHAEAVLSLVYQMTCVGVSK